MTAVDADMLFIGQAYIVAGFLFHLFKNCFLGLEQMQDKGVFGLGKVIGGSKADLV